MRIHFPIGAFYPSQIGGPCNTLYWHCCSLHENGIKINVVTTALGIEEGTVQFNKPIDDKCGTVYYSSGISFSYDIIKKIVKGIRSADVIHLNSLFNILSIFSFFYTKIFCPKKKIIWSVRGELSPDALKFSRIKKIPVLFLYKILGKKALFHSTSEKETAEIKSIFGNVNIVEVANFIEPSKRLSFENKKQFLYLGRIHKIKGIHKMIKGFAESKLFLDSDFKLVMVGKHEERHQEYYHELLRMISEYDLEHKVEWKGHLVGEEKETVYAESYALILPSETENFGNVVIESLNQGTPVIASKGTPWAILEKYKCGYHIENTPSEIANYIDKLISLSQDDYKELRKNAMNLIDDEFNIKTKINKWINIYKDEVTK